MSVSSIGERERERERESAGSCWTAVIAVSVRKGNEGNQERERDGCSL